jgi:hypothetical protein
VHAVQLDRQDAERIRHELQGLNADALYNGSSTVDHPNAEPFGLHPLARFPCPDRPSVNAARNSFIEDQV